jgi:hypothetical protein
VSLGLLILLVVVGTTVWVGVDASKRDWSGSGGGAATWVVGCILLWIVVFPIYLVKRGKAPLKDAPSGSAKLSPPGSTYRECPHCKEPIRRDADTCPHCRRPSTPWRFHEGRWWYRDTELEPWQWLDDNTGTWRALDSSPQPIQTR